MENPLIQQRLEKLNQLKERNGVAYPNTFRVDTTATELRKQYGELSREALQEQDKSYHTVAGRLMAKRLFGKGGFLSIKDRSGDIQLFVSKKSITEEMFEQFKQLLDIGDIIGVNGYPFVTKTGELSLHVTEFYILTKSLIPLPEKFHGLTDVELRYRQRYLDLIMNDDSKSRFIARSKVVQEMRNFFVSRDFLEVETPMLHSIAGGAAAKPFTTHHNALNMPLFMRIAPELHLKRLVVGGMERVFEINRNFRNEGTSTRHNPEFTMVEFYQAYATYRDLMDFTEEMIRHVAKTVFGTYQFNYQGHELDFEQPFKRLAVYDGINQYYPDAPETIFTSRDAAATFATSQGIKIESFYNHGKVLMELLEVKLEGKVFQPIFVTDFPLDVSPLSRKKDSDPSLVDRFELYIGGFEICNAFSELNDPTDQAERFANQIADKEAGDAEAHGMDEDYIRALQYGLPPTAGEGIGIDRLVMILTDAASIRDVILFPLLKHQ